MTSFRQIEANRRKFPIAISKLEINKRKRAASHTYQVKMTVSTYEQVIEAEDTRAKRGKKKTSRKAGRK